MIYIENKDGVQRVVIPANDTNVEYVNFVPQEGDSNYYTKTQTDERIARSRTAVLGEVGDWLSHYPTTDQMHDAIENVTVDLTGYATEDWVNEQGYATKQYVDDAVADIPAGGGGSADLSDYYTKGEVDTIEDGLQTQITDNHNSIIGLDSRVKDIELNGGGSGGDSGVKVYEALWDDATGEYTRFTNQMVSDMYDDYSNGLKVQLKFNNMLLTVYFAKQEASYYYVYVLTTNIMAEFIGYSNSPSDDAIFSEYPLVTREVFDRAIPHKYDYTITDDIALTGYFSQGEGYELFNDVRDGADVNFKLIMHNGQSKYIPFAIDYDSNMDMANFLFLDYGRYVMGTLDSNGDMSIFTENFN